MKTITLRMTDKEAEALERLAYIRGQSKNKALTSLLVEEYTNIGGGIAVDTPGGLEIVAMPDAADFGEFVQNTVYESDKKPSRQDLYTVLKALDYSIEHGAGEVTERQRAELLQDLEIAD